MNTIYIIDLESVETRYTCQWKKGLPELLKEKIPNYNIINISGNSSNNKTSTGAFLDFAFTNIYKSEQAIHIAELFQSNQVKAGDKFLFADFWNSTIIQVKYMSELLDIPVEIHAIVHAGSYDPQDFLGRKIKDKRWSMTFEVALYYAIDFNYFATNFHIDLFKRELAIDDTDKKIFRSGQPHNKLTEHLVQYEGVVKDNLILFPHRVTTEKQPEIFRDLAEAMPEYEWIICQEKNLSKHEYHQLLARSKMIFSANLQETLGISAMEGVLLNSIPYVPNRLSYKEMYEDQFRYDSNWTIDWLNYTVHKDELIADIRSKMTNYDSIIFDKQCQTLHTDYLYPGEMITQLGGVA